MKTLKPFAFVLLVLVLASVVPPPLAGQPSTGIAQLKTAGLTATSSTCTATACLQMNVTAGTGGIAVQLAGTFVGTVTFEGTVNGTNWVAIQVIPPGTSRTGVTTATAAGIWQANVVGLTGFRARCSAFTSGTINVALNRSGHPAPNQ